MSEHTNKYRVHFVHAVNTLVLFPNTVQFIFFAEGKMQMQCAKRYIYKYIHICLYVYMGILCVYMHTNIYVCMYIGVYYMFIYLCIYTV